MKAEKFTLRQLQDYAVKQRLSRYYIHLQLKHDYPRRYYGAESYTLQRIVGRRLPLVTFSGEQGLANCQAIEARYRGHYTEATIYQRQPGGTWQPIASFAHGLAPVVQLPKPAPTVKVRVVHNTLEGSVTFYPNQQAA